MNNTDCEQMLLPIESTISGIIKIEHDVEEADKENVTGGTTESSPESAE